MAEEVKEAVEAAEETTAVVEEAPAADVSTEASAKVEETKEEGVQLEGKMAEFVDWIETISVLELSKLVKALDGAREGKIAKLIRMLDLLSDLREAMEMHPEINKLASETMPFLKGLVRYADAARLAILIHKYPHNRQLRDTFEREFARAEKTGMQPAGGQLRKFITDIIE